MKRKLYLSSHEAQNARAAGYALHNAYHTVVSTWHDLGAPIGTAEDWGALIASRNFPQIEEADALVLFASGGLVPGGKFVEAGYALGKGKPVYVIGRIENKMLYHPQVKQFASVSDLIAWLAGH